MFDFGVKNCPFTPSWAKEQFFSKKGLCHVLVFIESKLTQKIRKKSNEPILRKKHYRMTDGRMDRAQFIGSSSRAGGPKG